MREKLSKSVMKINKDTKVATVCCYHGKEVKQRQDKIAKRHGYELSHGMCTPHFEEEAGKIGVSSRGLLSKLFGNNGK